MSGFLDYLNEFNTQKITSVVKTPTEEKKDIVQPKVLCMDVEIRTVQGAKLVIEKLQNWISKQESKETLVMKESKKAPTKPYRIPPKKVIKNPIQEAHGHAVDILDGLSDEPVIVEQMIPGNINTMKAPQDSQPNVVTVAGHASALL